MSFCLSFNTQHTDGAHTDTHDPFDRWGRALNSPKKDARGGTRTHDLALGWLACYRWAREGQLLASGSLSIHYIELRLSRIIDKWDLPTRWHRTEQRFATLTGGTHLTGG